MDILYWTGGFIVVCIVIAIVVYRAAVKEVSKTRGED